MITDTQIDLQPWEAQASLFKALAHPARLAILALLQDGEHCVCHIEAHLGLRQAYISQQLAVLRAAGLVQDRRDGWNVYYCISAPAVYPLLAAAAALLGASAPPDAAVVRAAVVCSCPTCETGSADPALAAKSA
jgi:ArsR family transcriptional regulator